MLSWSCRRFRAELPREAGHPHRLRCRECAAFASALERAAAGRLALPASLREKLRALPVTLDQGGGPRFPLPAIPMPPHLRSRLRALPQQEATATLRELPPWVRSSRYAVAACYLLAVLAVHLLGNPLEMGRRAAAPVSAKLRQVWQQTGEEIAGPLQQLESGVAERVDATRDALQTSIADLKSRMTTVTRELFPG